MMGEQQPSLEEIERRNRASLGALNRRLQAMFDKANRLEDALTDENDEGRLEYERNLLWNTRTVAREEAEILAAAERIGKKNRGEF